MCGAFNKEENVKLQRVEIHKMITPIFRTFFPNYHVANSELFVAFSSTDAPGSKSWVGGTPEGITIYAPSKV